MKMIDLDTFDAARLQTDPCDFAIVPDINKIPSVGR